MVNESQFDVTQSVPTFNFAGQKAEGQDLLNRYSSTIKGFTPSSNIYQKYADQFGVGTLKEAANKYREMAGNIGNQISALPGQMGERTRESLVTQGQKDRMVQSEAQPMMEQMTEIGQLGENIGARASEAEQMAGMLTGMDVEQQDRQLLPFEMESSMMEQRQAREFSGYTFREQAELDRLMQNKRLGLEWTNAEAQRAADLSLKELGYREALKYMKEEKQQETISQGYIKNL